MLAGAWSMKTASSFRPTATAQVRINPNPVPHQFLVHVLIPCMNEALCIPQTHLMIGHLLMPWEHQHQGVNCNEYFLSCAVLNRLSALRRLCRGLGFCAAAE